VLLARGSLENTRNAPLAIITDRDELGQADRQGGFGEGGRRSTARKRARPAETLASEARFAARGPQSAPRALYNFDAFIKEWKASQPTVGEVFVSWTSATGPERQDCQGDDGDDA